jgi:hypothetical protein
MIGCQLSVVSSVKELYRFDQTIRTIGQEPRVVLPELTTDN